MLPRHGSIRLCGPWLISSRLRIQIGVTNATGSHVARRQWRESVSHAIETIGGLTAVDGAAIISDKYELLTFGAKIHRRDGAAQIEQS